MSKTNNYFLEERSNFDQSDFVDDQYRYREYLNSIEEQKRDKFRMPQNKKNEQNIQLWHWPSDHS